MVFSAPTLGWAPGYSWSEHRCQAQEGVMSGNGKGHKWAKQAIT